jgi:tetratricopeptide (TPR) repeat protein
MKAAAKEYIYGKELAAGLLCLMLVLSVFLSPNVCFADATKVYLNAREALSRKDFAVGVKNYYRLVSFSEIVLSNSIKAADLSAAREFFENAAGNDEKADKARLFLALIDRITGEIDRAHEQIDSLRELHPRSLLLAYVKGELHLSQNQVPAARPFFEWVLNAGENSSFATLSRSLLSFYLGAEGIDPEERRKFLLAAANRNWDLLEIEQAIRFFEIAARDFPHEREAFRSLVQIYLDMDNMEKAVEVYQSWKSNNTARLLAPLAQAHFHLAIEEYSEAAVILKELLTSDSENVALKLALADCLFNLADYEKAFPLYQELLAINQEDVGVVSRLKSCFEALGKTDETIAMFESLTTSGSTNPWFQLELAELYLKTGNYDQSEIYYDLLSSSENPYSDYASEMSAQIAQYRHEKALAEYEAAERLAAAQREQTISQATAGNTALPSTERVREVQVDELKKLMAIYE